MSGYRRLVHFAIAVAGTSILAACSGGGSSTVGTRVDVAVADGDTAKAVRLLRGLVHRSDADAERFMQLGAFYRSRGDITGRLHSQSVLETGLSRYPDHPGILMELGKTYYAQTFYGDAAKCFNRVLELVPGHCEAHYYSGKNWYRKWKHVQVWRDYMRNAREHFLEVVACDPSNRDAFFKLAVSNFVLGDTTRAHDVCEALLTEHPDHWRARMLLGSIAYSREMFEECRDHFDAGITMLSDEELEGFQDIGLLLAGDELEEYQAAPERERETMRRSFWAEHDPDITTAINERYLEHIHRVFLADVFFDHPDPPLRGWETERGKAVIKFGWPDGVGTTLAGEFTSGRMEVWTYANPYYAGIFFFRDEFLNGNYQVPGDPRFSFAAQALYQDDPVTAIEEESVPIPGVLDVVAFKNNSYASDVYLTMRVDVDSMVQHLDPAWAGSFVTRSAFFADEWTPLFYRSDTLAVDPVVDHARHGDRWLYLVQKFDLPYDRHRVAFCLEDELAIVQSISKASASTMKFFSDSLTLSDILFHQPPPERDDGATIHRGDRSYFPNPGALYGTADKLKLYVEIYNLQVTELRSVYDITYSIYEEEKKRGRWDKIKSGLKFIAGFRSSPEPVISQTIERSALGHIAREDLTIDIASLEAGRYELKITVFDRHAGYAAEAVRSFAKLEGGVN